MTTNHQSFLPSVKSLPYTVLIATDDFNSAQNIIPALVANGFDTKFSIFDGRSLNKTPLKTPDAVLFLFSDKTSYLPAITKALRKHFQTKKIPFIGVLEHVGDKNTRFFDSTVFQPAHISQIANRVNSMVRLGQIEREIKRRISTLRENFNLNYDIEDFLPKSAFRILFVGKASPEFMIIINALQKKNVEVVAAFTSFSAFDFLHERKFDAVIMNAIKQTETALSITETMRRNAKLYHIPTIFFVDPETFQSRDYDLAYAKGAKEIISVGSDTREISGRILELANYHHIHSQLKREYDSLVNDASIDVSTGLYNEAFLRAHMKNVFHDLKQRDEPLSMLAIKASPNAVLDIPPDYIISAVNQIGQMLKNFVRMQDVIARISYDIFIISFFRGR